MINELNNANANRSQGLILSFLYQSSRKNIPDSGRSPSYRSRSVRCKSPSPARDPAPISPIQMTSYRPHRIEPRAARHMVPGWAHRIVCVWACPPVTLPGAVPARGEKRSSARGVLFAGSGCLCHGPASGPVKNGRRNISDSERALHNFMRICIKWNLFSFFF